jgi:hypothetical protein
MAVDEGARSKHEVDVDGTKLRVPGPVVTGREVLEVAGKLPPDDYIVYWIGKDNVLRDLGLEGKVHLHEHHVERFLTFQADRSFRFEIDGKREDWGCPVITEETIRKLAGADHRFRVWIERSGEPDRLIPRGETVALAAPEIERFRVERIYSIEILNEDNGVDFRLEALKETKLDTLFVEMYERLGVPRRGDDRLHCEEPGEDVFRFGHLTLGHYLEQGNCPCLVWCFAGGTGGAVCQ